MCFSHVNSTNLDYIFCHLFSCQKIEKKNLDQTPFKTNLSFSLSISLSLSSKLKASLNYYCDFARDVEHIDNTTHANFGWVFWMCVLTQVTWLV
jgi:hypothetical protein